MAFYFFVEGPLLRIVFTLFFAGVLTRILLFISTIVRSKKSKEKALSDTLKILSSLFLPFHRVIIKKPYFTVLRYGFHICLFAVPIWLSGHIVLWSESRFGWDWIMLPEAWADGMTLSILILAAYFFLRRLIIADLRKETSIADILFIIITAMPFLTGYFLKHDTFYAIPALGDNMAVIHMLSGEMTILMVIFLFYRTRLNVNKCIGCASCVQNCPTETLESRDRKGFRIFDYAHFQCICCGSCVNVCPEDAAALRHEINPKRFTQIFSKQEIRTVKLEACQRCGGYFAPELQMKKISTELPNEFLNYCPNCRKANMGDRIRQTSPRYNRKNVHYRERIKSA